MILWLETCGLIALAIAAGWLGHWLSRQRRWWAISYGVAVLVIVLVAIGRRFSLVAVVPPFSWLLSGRLEFLLMASMIPILVMCLIRRVERRLLRLALLGLMVVGVGGYALPAFLAPALMQNRFRDMSNVYLDGICQQQTSYTCGPAAAVIAMERMGWTAKEGQLALAARTGVLTGTDEDLLAAVIEDRYPVTVRQVATRDPRSIPPGALAIAVVKYGTWVDHYVTVWQVSDGSVLLGDPAAGRKEMPLADFREWSRGRMLIIEPRQGY